MYVLVWANVKSLSPNTGNYHRTCYQSCMHPSLLVKWTKEDPLTSEKNKTPKPTTKRLTRSQVETFDKELCFFCQSEDTDHLFNMSSFNMDANIRKVIENNQELQIRYSHAFDARAGDLKYHRYCAKAYVYVPMTKDIDNTLDLIKLLDEGFFLSLEESLRDGLILTLVDVTESYHEILLKHG